MEMTYGGALVMPSSYAMMDEDEMMYVEGGMSVTDMALNLLISVVGGVIGTKIAPYCTVANFKIALSIFSNAARTVWAAVGNAIGFAWNTPVMTTCVVVALGTAIGIMSAYYYRTHK